MKPPAPPEILDGAARLLAPGALHLPDARALVVADLHLGFEAAHAARGALMPVGHAVATATAHARALVRETGATTLVVAGDFKHGAGARRLDEAREVRAFIAAVRAAGARVVVARGNHDRGIEAMVGEGVPVVDALDLGGVRVAHGHARVARPRGGLLATGHQHPVLALADAVGAEARFPAFLYAPARGHLVLPSLSPWARGADFVRAPAFQGPVLSRLDPADFEAWGVMDDRVLPFGPLGVLARALAR
ncbi:MAG TPA: metallophosphoesterase [Candidatus Thermoplasmatota archaeon]|nr:metallophosphoesterase [Candidatus Thermoplasmatota archaeon]